MTEDVEVLYGDPDIAGQPFVIRIRELPGGIVPPHSHSVDENITVVSGTWYFGIGEEYDAAKLKKLPIGGYAFAPRGVTMFGYSPGPQPAIVQVHGIGPFDIHWKHEAGSFDDPAGAAFRFHRGDSVVSARGKGVVREGYASGAIVQYEIERADATRFMANESDLRRP